MGQVCARTREPPLKKTLLVGTGGQSVLVSEFFLCVASLKCRVDTIAVMETAHVFG